MTFSSPLQNARRHVSSIQLPASIADFGKQDAGNYADKLARGWYYDGQALRPFHLLTPEILARSLHAFITVSETRADDDMDLPPGISKIKGLPHLPPEYQWPKGALFLAQFNMADLVSADVSRILPAEGILYFFFNPNTAEGFVDWYTGPLDRLSPRPYPEADLPPLAYFLDQYRDRSYLATFHPEAAFCIDGVLEALPGQLKNDVSAMLGCPLAGRAIGDNLFGQPGYYQGENELIGDRQADGAPDLLLFQYEFGEGRIHFWISPDELRRRDFTQVWLGYSGT